MLSQSSEIIIIITSIYPPDSWENDGEVVLKIGLVVKLSVPCPPRLEMPEQSPAYFTTLTQSVS